MKEPFGRRNRPAIEKPPLAKARKLRPAAPARAKSGAKASAKVYLYIAGGVLFLVLAGYALA